MISSLAPAYQKATDHSGFAERTLPQVMAREQLLGIEIPLTRPTLQAHWHQHWAKALAAGVSDTD
ncbi:MAG: hypothetical protein ACO31B_01970, partial [Burkholderiaceae bacterium]